MLNGSWLNHKTIKCKKNSALFSQLQSNPSDASPREQLYEQMTSTVIQPLQREIYEKPTFIRLPDSRLEQKSLVMITLYRACTYVFGLSTL